jgi:integrase/recombinase XerD
MSQITFETSKHKNQHIIKILFAFNKEISDKVKKYPNALWSKTMGCWYVPDTIENRQRFNIPNYTLYNETAKYISLQNREQLQLFCDKLVLKGYSSSTLKTYRNEFIQLLAVLKDKAVCNLEPSQLIRYMLYCTNTLKLSENTLHSRLNAIKFYVEQVLHKEKFFYEIPRPKKPFKLPRLISEEKILLGLLAVENKKHQAILMTAYSAGLRVSEVVKLKITDIDSNRMQIFIAAAKGKKDRMATLSKFNLQLLRDYVRLYKPKTYLFEGQFFDTHYSIRSAQEVFKLMAEKLKLPNNLGFHSLRHSYATHLLENGTDIKYIQELLGHNDIKTTLRYTHVSKKDLGKIESPLDKIMQKNNQ